MSSYTSCVCTISPYWLDTGHWIPSLKEMSGVKFPCFLLTTHFKRWPLIQCLHISRDTPNLFFTPHDKGVIRRALGLICHSENPGNLSEPYRRRGGYYRRMPKNAEYERIDRGRRTDRLMYVHAVNEFRDAFERDYFIVFMQNFVQQIIV